MTLLKRRLRLPRIAGGSFGKLLARWFAVTLFLAPVADAGAQTYCPSDGGTGNIFFIDRVTLGDLDNPSGSNSGYGDFTDLPLQVTAGSTLNVELDPGGPFFLRYRWRAWLDLNNNGSFNDPGERVIQTTGFGIETATVSIPAGTPPGNYRMRVSMRAFGYMSSCAQYNNGEVEDYTVQVVEECPALAGTMNAWKDEECLPGEDVVIGAVPGGDAEVPSGYTQAYVLTTGAELVIIGLNSAPEFTVTEGGLYTIHSFVYPTGLDLSVVELGVTTGFDVNSLLIQGGGDICASLDVAGAQTVVSDPMAGTMSGGGDVCLQGESAMLMATADGNANVPEGYSQAYVLTSGAGLVIEQLGGTPEFTVTEGGLYTIHSFVYPSGLDLSVVVPGETTGFDVNGLLVQGGGELCASLDVAGAAFNVADPMAGTMSGGGDVCLQGESAMLMATADGNANVPEGYTQAYVLTSGAGLVIEQLGGTPEFTVTEGGLYTIHSFVYPTGLDLSVVVPGETTGFDVNGLLVQGGGELCASLDVAGAVFNVADPMAGTMSGGGDVCLEGEGALLLATANGDANVPEGYSQAYVLTNGEELVIVELGTEPSFTVTVEGLYTIHSFVYPTGLDLSVVVPGETTGFEVNGLLVQGGGELCASLDVAGAVFNVADPMAGTMSGGADVCLQGDDAMLMAMANGDANVPEGYSQAYVLTTGAELVIVGLGGTPEFTVTEGGLYTIHSFVYPTGLDLSVVEVGVTTGFDVNGLLVQGGGELCASLDVAGAQFNVADPMAGTMSGGGDVCLEGEGALLTATANGDANVPEGYSQAYVLTSGPELVIIELGGAPEFSVTVEGTYTIHSFVYPTGLDLSVVEVGVTTGFDVNGLLVQGGGELCASLDVAGAAFNVASCECLAEAGTMNAWKDEECLPGDEVVIGAIPGGDAVVPADYTQAYVLTTGAELVIIGLNSAPEFTITEGGLYTIHSFVYPSGLDLSVVELGVTTGFDVNGLLIQGGGELCASLDVAGAQTVVSDPMAGTMSGGGDACLEDGSVTLMATADGNAIVPEGYSQAYVLTSGAGLVIEQLGGEPSFDVTEGGLYTIHSFVYPTDLDLSVVVPGETTGFDVNGLLIQGGGDLCASLDVEGTVFNVADDCVCTADAGSLTAWKDEECLIDGQITIGAVPNGDANVPTGYSQAYVLTSGSDLVIIGLGGTPEFTVTEGGLYTIHSFVYPTGLDLSVVELGVTTGFDVNGLLIQGGGELCASLDVPGASVNVSGPYAGNIHPDHFLNCLSNGSTTINGLVAGDAQVPAGYETIYVLTRGQGLLIVNAGPEPEFTITQPGLYRIHTLVYDPATLDLGIVVPGVTTGFDVNGLLVQGGGDICASLDVQGAPFLVLHGWICDWFQFLFRDDMQDPMNELSIVLGQGGQELSDDDLKVLTAPAPANTTLYPVPTRDILNMNIDAMLPMTMEISLMDLSGRIVKGTRTYDLEKGSSTLTWDVSDLGTGNYIVRMVANGEVMTEQFVKVQ